VGETKTIIHLMEGQEEGTKTWVGRGLMNDPKEDSSDMQDSRASPDPTDPIPPPPWAEIESTKGKEPEGRREVPG